MLKYNVNSIQLYKNIEYNIMLSKITLHNIWLYYETFQSNVMSFGDYFIMIS